MTEDHSRCRTGKEMITASLRTRARFTAPIVVVGICVSFALVGTILHYGRYPASPLSVVFLVPLLAAAAAAAYFHNRNLKVAGRLREGRCLRCGYPVECPVCSRCPECGHAESWAPRD